MIAHADRLKWGMMGAISKWSKQPPFEIRWWDRVDKRGAEECWPWKKTLSNSGYGKTKIRGKHTGAHRVAYELSNGPIPKGLQVCHHCDNKLCCNPKHLFLGTPKDNAQDKVNKGRQARKIGELHHMHILKEPDVKLIRELVVKGAPQTVLANLFGVCPATINSLVARRSWPHVV